MANRDVSTVMEEDEEPKKKKQPSVFITLGELEKMNLN